MKKIICLALCAMVFCLASATNDSTTIDSTAINSANQEVLSRRDSLLFEQLDKVQLQLREPIYKFYPTQNMYTFLELNTVTGQIWIVQWSTSGNRMKYTLSEEEQIYAWDTPIAGRFELYPTENMYNFVMLDNIKGYCYQVQWNFDVDKRFVIFIY
jgi:hypothetical protein